MPPNPITHTEIINTQIMNKALMIEKADILQHVKLSLEIPKAIESILKRKVVTDHALQAGLKLEKQELQQAADLIRLAAKIDKAADTWRWLEEHGLSLEDFEAIISINMLNQKLAEHLFTDKVENYFFENHLNYLSASIYEIIFQDENEAIDYFYAIQEGEVSFFDIAHQQVGDESLRKACGYRGNVTHGSLKPELAAAIFAATPPQLLKPAVSSGGTHLILVDSIDRQELDEQTKEDIIAELFEAWLGQQIKTIDFSKSLGNT
jgi:parvulin-like peptidyl-prolyl isomerase